MAAAEPFVPTTEPTTTVSTFTAGEIGVLNGLLRANIDSLHITALAKQALRERWGAAVFYPRTVLKGTALLEALRFFERDQLAEGVSKQAFISALIALLKIGCRQTSRFTTPLADTSAFIVDSIVVPLLLTEGLFEPHLLDILRCTLTATPAMLRRLPVELLAPIQAAATTYAAETAAAATAAEAVAAPLLAVAQEVRRRATTAQRVGIFMGFVDMLNAAGGPRRTVAGQLDYDARLAEAQERERHDRGDLARAADTAETAAAGPVLAAEIARAVAQEAADGLAAITEVMATLRVPTVATVRA